MPGSGLVISQIQGVTIVSFRDVSILDGRAVEQIGEELYVLIDEQARRKVLLDFRQVKFLSSTMLGILIAMHKKALTIKGKVVICGLRPKLYEVFKMMKLHKVLQFADNEEEAMKAFNILGRA